MEKTNNVEILRRNGELSDIRKRLGADNGNDASFDNKINDLSAHDLMKEWSAWHLGDAHWWTVMKELFDELQNQNQTMR